MRSFFLYNGNTLVIFHCEGNRPVSIVSFIMQAKEAAISGPASCRSWQEMLLRPVALFGDNLPSNFRTWLAVVCCKVNVIGAGLIYESKLVLPVAIVVARFGPTDVKYSFKISHISSGFLKDLSPLFSSLINKLLVHLRYVNSLIVLHISLGSLVFWLIFDLY